MPSSLRRWPNKDPRARRLVRRAGCVTFAVAFLLPACRFAGKSELIGFGTYSGWQCAKLSLVLALSSETYHSPLVLALLGGLINPLIVLYLAFYRPRFTRLRRAFAWATGTCLIATWVFFIVAEFMPLIGHLLWVLGILMILAGELESDHALGPVI